MGIRGRKRQEVSHAHVPTVHLFLSTSLSSNCSRVCMWMWMRECVSVFQVYLSFHIRFHHLIRVRYCLFSLNIASHITRHTAKYSREEQLGMKLLHAHTHAHTHKHTGGADAERSLALWHQVKGRGGAPRAQFSTTHSSHNWPTHSSWHRVTRLLQTLLLAERHHWLASNLHAWPGES